LLVRVSLGPDSEAQFCLARLCARGDGVPQEFGEATKWFRKAAEQGVPAAQFNIAVFCLQGTGVARDAVSAADWFR
jgi:TPR repeat protein